MQTAKIFKSGGSQAVRIPKDMRLEGSEVYIKRVPEGLLLMPKREHTETMWAEWAAKLAQYDEPLTIERGGPPQEREFKRVPGLVVENWTDS